MTIDFTTEEIEILIDSVEYRKILEHKCGGDTKIYDTINEKLEEKLKGKINGK